MKRMMILFVSLFAASTALATMPGGGDMWHTNMQQAIKEASNSGKYMLIDFTGSDWCGWCIKLDKEVFSQSEFKSYANENLVLVSLDFPRKKEVSADIKKQNAHWQNIYGIKGYPTIVLADPSGRPVARFGYRKGGATPYVDYVSDLISKDKQMFGAAAPGMQEH